MLSIGVMCSKWHISLWTYIDIGQVTKLWLSCYLVLLSIYQLIAKPGNKTASVSWPDPYTIHIVIIHSYNLYTETKTFTATGMIKLLQGNANNMIYTPQIDTGVLSWWKMMPLCAIFSQKATSLPNYFFSSLLFSTEKWIRISSESVRNFFNLEFWIFEFWIVHCNLQAG